MYLSIPTVAMFLHFRHCQRFWGASGDFWQAQWDKFLDTVGEDPFNLWVYGTFVLSFGVYWLFGGIYTVMDLTSKPSAIRRYKIQPGTNEPVDNTKLLKVRGAKYEMLIVSTISFSNFVSGPHIEISYTRWYNFFLHPSLDMVCTTLIYNNSFLISKDMCSGHNEIIYIWPECININMHCPK